MAGKQTAIEVKYVEDWATSLRNPDVPKGQTPWAIPAQDTVVRQARVYSLAFEGGVVYHVNNSDFIEHYTKAFQAAGVTNFKFILTPAGN